jgi:undecaprenyl diphosphate synthase
LNSKPQRDIEINLDPQKIPTHVAIIMDGSGRWAKKRLLNRIRGHEQGAETVRTIVRTSRKLGIAHLTLYAFSTENWQRPKAEVGALMTLLRRFLQSEERELLENNIRLNAIGQIDRLPQEVGEELKRVMLATRANTAMQLNLALSYGGRMELVEMVRQLAFKIKSGAIEPEEIDESMIGRHLYTAGIPDPDLMIRTSGEMRISNFLLWQIAYSEIYITETFWPDFGAEEYLEILKAYQKRERRFGKVAP